MTPAELRIAVQEEASDIRRMLGLAESAEGPDEVAAIELKFRGATALVDVYLTELRKALETP